MASFATAETNLETMVNMGQIESGRAPKRLKSVLGSCIGLALYHPRIKGGAFAHIVLPESAGRSGTPGKFADTAFPEMLKLMAQMGAGPHALIAKFAGGANMFSGSGPLQIGDANTEAVTLALRRAGIRVAGKHVGGTAGRRVTFDCSTGAMTVQIAGKPETTL